MCSALTLAEALSGPSRKPAPMDEPNAATSLLIDIEEKQVQDDSSARARRRKFIQDAVLGASDGSTVPFALAAGLATSTNDSRIIVVAVVAELAAGFIAMGLGGYLATAAEETFLVHERTRLKEQLLARPDELHERLSKILRPLAISQDSISKSIQFLAASPDLDTAVDFIMRNELSSTDEADVNPFASMVTVGFSYVVAGIIPALPYLFIAHASTALNLSIVVGLCSLFSFGYAKGALLGGDRLSQAIQTVLLGAFAAITSYALASYVTQSS